MKRPKSLLILIFCFSNCITFGQSNFNEIKNGELRKILIEGFDSSKNLMRTLQIEYPKKSILFRFNYSTVTLKNNDDAPIFSFAGSDTVIYQIDDIEEIRYSFLYSYNKVEKNYSIIYYPNKNAIFSSKSTESELTVLSQLEKEGCAKCFNAVDNFIKISKIKNYKLGIVTTNVDAKEISNRFLWQVMEKKPNGPGGLVLVSPVTGKKVDMDKIYVTPKIK
jgi:hypothetical protein